MMRHARIALSGLVAALVNIHFARGENAAITKLSDFKCTTFYDPLAQVTDLSTGRGVGFLRYDIKTDNVPPCSGNLDRPPIIFGEYPLPNPIPQLVKIRSDGGQCSGDLIAPDAVITAAHCVVDRERQMYYRNINITPGYQNGKSVFPTFVGTTALTFRAYTAGGNTAHDIAVIKFAGTMLSINWYYNLSIFDVSKCGTSFLKNYTEPHYSPDINHNETQAGVEGQITSCVQGMITAPLPLGPGSSGSALSEPSNSIFAIHSQYSTSPAASYDAVVTNAKICVIREFLSGIINGNKCASGTAVK